MKTTMSRDEFINGARVYINRLFTGICEYSFQIAVNQISQVIRFVAKVNEKDFESIKYSDVYPSAQKLVTRMGEIRRDPAGQAYISELKLHDPYFEGLDYQDVPEESEIWGD